jgi:hypothetical protein
VSVSDDASNDPPAAEPTAPAPLPAELVQADPGILVDSIRGSGAPRKTAYAKTAESSDERTPARDLDAGH